MSDTPMTDAAEVCDCDESTGFKARFSVSSEFARQLERENEALRKDAERYRWLRRSGANWIHADVHSDIEMQKKENYDWPNTINKVIDAAIKEQSNGY